MTDNSRFVNRTDNLTPSSVYALYDDTRAALIITCFDGSVASSDAKDIAEWLTSRDTTGMHYQAAIYGWTNDKGELTEVPLPVQG